MIDNIDSILATAPTNVLVMSVDSTKAIKYKLKYHQLASGGGLLDNFRKPNVNSSETDQENADDSTLSEPDIKQEKNYKALKHYDQINLFKFVSSTNSQSDINQNLVNFVTTLPNETLYDLVYEFKQKLLPTASVLCTNHYYIENLTELFQMALMYNRYNSNYPTIFNKYNEIINYHPENTTQTAFCIALNKRGFQDSKYEKLCNMLMSFGAHTVDKYVYDNLLANAYKQGAWFKDNPKFLKSVMTKMVQMPNKLLDGDTLLTQMVKDNKGAEIGTVMALMQIAEINSKVFLEAKNYYNDIALHIACMKGNITMVKQLILHHQLYSDPHILKSEGLYGNCNILHIAVLEQDKEMMESILLSYISEHPNKSDKLVNYLKSPINICNEFSFNAIHLICHRMGDNFKLLERIMDMLPLDKITDLVINSKIEKPVNESPVPNNHHLINDTNAINVYDNIFKKRMLFNPHTLKSHFTPVHLACRVGNYEIVNRIVHGSLDYPDNLLSPIHVAVMNQQIHIVQLLLDKSYAKYDHYNINRKSFFSQFIESIKDFFGTKQQSIETQIQNYKDKVEAHFKESKVYKLITHTADNTGNNILHLACQYNCLDVVKRIVEHPMFYNYDVATYIETPNKDKNTPRMIARYRTHHEIYQYLQQQMDRHNHIHIVDILNRLTNYPNKQKPQVHNGRPLQVQQI